MILFVHNLALGGKEQLTNSNSKKRAMEEDVFDLGCLPKEMLLYEVIPRLSHLYIYHTANSLTISNVNEI